MKKEEDKGTAKKKQTCQEGRTGKMMVAGGSFIRAHYKLPPLGEDIKNAIVALFQFVLNKLLTFRKRQEESEKSENHL